MTEQDNERDLDGDVMTVASAPKAVKTFTRDQFYDLLNELFAIAVANSPDHQRSKEQLRLEWARDGIVEVFEKYGRVHFREITFQLNSEKGSQPE